MKDTQFNVKVTGYPPHDCTKSTSWMGWEEVKYKRTNSCQTKDYNKVIRFKKAFDTVFDAKRKLEWTKQDVINRNNKQPYRDNPQQFCNDWVVYVCSVCGKFHFGNKNYLTEKDTIVKI